MKPLPVVYIVDDDPEFLNAMSLFGSAMELDPRAFESSQSFLEAFEPGQVGCALVDLRMPDLNGIGVQAQLKKLDPEFPFIMITGYADVPSALKVSQGGAFGFLEKPVDPSDIKKMIRSAVRQSISLNPTRKARGMLATLTDRERDVFELVVLGYSNQKASEHLSINIKTIESHRSSMMKKLKACCLQDLIAFNNKISMRKAS